MLKRGLTTLLILMLVPGPWLHYLSHLHPFIHTDIKSNCCEAQSEESSRHDVKTCKWYEQVRKFVSVESDVPSIPMTLLIWPLAKVSFDQLNTHSAVQQNGRSPPKTFLNGSL